MGKLDTEAWPARDWSRQEPDLSLFFLGLQGESGRGFWPFSGSLPTWGQVWTPCHRVPCSAPDLPCLFGLCLPSWAPQAREVIQLAVARWRRECNLRGTRGSPISPVGPSQRALLLSAFGVACAGSPGPWCSVRYGVPGCLHRAQVPLGCAAGKGFFLRK